MNHSLFLSAAALLFVSGEKAQTQYTVGRTLRVEAHTTIAMETTSFEMERDGEPVDVGFGGGSSSEKRSVVMKDTVLAAEEGKPTRLRREFVEISGESLMSRGDQEVESERECPLSEVTLELTLEDGDVQVEVVDGSEPDDEATLEGHQLALAIDALLPSEDVEAGDSWELDGELLTRAMMFDLESALYPRPQRSEDEAGGRGGRGGRGGMRGGRRGGSPARFFEAGDWDAKATLSPDKEEHEGIECLVINIEAECSGSLPEPEGGFGGGRRGGGGRALSLPLAPARENTFEVELEGKLYFDAAGGRPVHLELEGSIATESNREMNRGESSMSISSSEEGTILYTVDLAVVGSEDE
jgi:hypothetical protein